MSLGQAGSARAADSVAGRAWRGTARPAPLLVHPGDLAGDRHGGWGQPPAAAPDAGL